MLLALVMHFTLPFDLIMLVVMGAGALVCWKIGEEKFALLLLGVAVKSLIDVARAFYNVMRRNLE
jgi:hypothetical protein